MDLLLHVVGSVAFVAGFVASARAAVYPLGAEFVDQIRNPFLALALHDGWLVVGAIFALAAFGMFARGEMSPWPLTAFYEAQGRHGTLDGLFSLVWVLLADFGAFIGFEQMRVLAGDTMMFQRATGLIPGGGVRFCS
jgi:hypothetical protein